MKNQLSEEEKKLQEVVLSRLMRLNATINGLVFGLVFGLAIFVVTNWLILKGGPVVGPTLSLLGQIFIGYKVTFLGSLVGFLYAFVTGFVFGYFIAAVYNWVVDLRDSKPKHQ